MDAKQNTAMYTPGPWDLQPVHDGWAAFAPSLGFNPARTVFQCRKAGPADAEAAANARLIAAAPDLLAALEGIMHFEMAIVGPHSADRAIAARAAIAKARNAA